MNQTATSQSATGVERHSDLQWMIIAIAIVIQTARVFGMASPKSDLPFLSANDRSRWCAIAALTEDGGWEIDRFIVDDKGKNTIWHTIDMVRHRGPDGKEHYYSSKPPLLTVLYAAVCKPVTWIFGKKLTQEPYLIGRTVMFLVNVVPMALWWIAVQVWLVRNVRDHWVRSILLLAVLFGTFLTTFTATLNNHLHGAIAFSISLGVVWRIASNARQELGTSLWLWIVAGLSAALTVACELPALAWAAAAGGMLAMVDWRKCAIGYVVSGLVVAVAFFGCNLWSNGDLRPPYAHRDLGPLIVTLPQSESIPGPAEIIRALDPKVYPFTDKARIEAARLENVKQLVDDTTLQRVAIRQTQVGWGVYGWDDWYDYPKSYWLPDNKKGVDRGEPNRWTYLLHITIGHHGVFSLTPLWIVALIGGALWIRGSWPKRTEQQTFYGACRGWLISESGIAATLFAVTLACFVFYVSRDVVDRNYAGVCSGFRWMFWLIPAWLWFCVPALEQARNNRILRGLIQVALLISIFSATVPWPNPWSHPWLYRILMWMFPTTYS